MLSKIVSVDSKPLVKESTYSVGETEKDYSTLIDISNRIFHHFHDKCKLITLRPSTELMYFKYNSNYLDSYKSNLIELNIPFYASVEKNKDYGYHMHIIFLQKDTSKKINKFLKEKFDIRHKLEITQHAVHQDDGKDLLNKIKYYVGVREQSVKPEYVENWYYRFNYQDYDYDKNYFSLKLDAYDIKHRLEYLSKCRVCGKKEEDVVSIKVCQKHYKKIFKIKDLKKKDIEIF